MVIVLALVAGVAHANDLADRLATDDPRALDAAITAIEHAPADADALFAAGRACEDKLHAPARALALYDRLVHELPDAATAVAAARRAEQLRARIGPSGEHAAEATELAQLQATADTAPADQVIARADRLAAAPWPGAADTALWLADWLCRTQRFADAQTRYAQLASSSRQAARARALRAAASCALDAHDWQAAGELAARISTADPEDAAVRDEVLAAAARGRHRAQLYIASWIALVAAFAALAGSLAEAALRGGRKRPPLRPPIEVLFLAPIALVLIVVSFTAHRAIAPAVTRISLVGLAFAWLSGTALDLARSRGRSVRLRAVGHIASCAIGVLAIGYIAMTRDNLLDLLAETVKFGPDA